MRSRSWSTYKARRIGSARWKIQIVSSYWISFGEDDKRRGRKSRNGNHSSFICLHFGGIFLCFFSVRARIENEIGSAIRARVDLEKMQTFFSSSIKHSTRWKGRLANIEFQIARFPIAFSFASNFTFANREENSNVGFWVMMPFEKGSLIQQQLKLSECFEVIQQPFFIFPRK